MSDWVEQFFVFMRCGPDHHTVNFLKSERSRMHHFAFELRDAAHLIASCDVLGQENLDIVWGPVRHGPGHNIATYHRNTDDLMIELYTELDRMSDEALGYFDPKPWHEDLPQRPKTWVGRKRRDVWGPCDPEGLSAARLLTGASTCSEGKTNDRPSLSSCKHCRRGTAAAYRLVAVERNSHRLLDGDVGEPWGHSRPGFCGMCANGNR